MTTAVVFGLVAIVLLHGAAAGVRVAAGRDGMLQHRATEGRGALRGAMVAVLLALPPVAAGFVDASRAAVRPALYVEAAAAGMIVYGPFAVLVVLAFCAARVGPWPSRAFANTVIVSGLEFVRPVVAWLGVAAAWWGSSDAVVVAIGAGGVTLALAAPSIIRTWWYSGPLTIPGHVEEVIAHESS